MDIETMARCAGLMKYVTPPGTREWHGSIDDIARLVSSAIMMEREACVMECERLMMFHGGRQESFAHRVVEARRAFAASLSNGGLGILTMESNYEDQRTYFRTHK